MSTTTGNRLAFLSGLSGVPAYQHLRKIAGFYGVAAAMLVAFSGYPTAPAWVHLFSPESTETAVGGSRGGPDYNYDWPTSKRKKAIEEALLSQPSLSAADREILAASLNAFLVAGSPDDTEAGRQSIRTFLDVTVDRLERADVVRRAASEQIVDDFKSSIDALRFSNNRRAMILVLLLMLL